MSASSDDGLTMRELLHNAGLDDDNLHALGTESLVALQDLRMRQGRPALLAHLKALGVSNLINRQKFANALQAGRGHASRAPSLRLAIPLSRALRVLVGP